MAWEMRFRGEWRIWLKIISGSSMYFSARNKLEHANWQVVLLNPQLSSLSAYQFILGLILSQNRHALKKTWNPQISSLHIAATLPFEPTTHHRVARRKSPLTPSGCSERWATRPERWPPDPSGSLQWRGSVQPLGRDGQQQTRMVSGVLCEAKRTYRFEQFAMEF